MPCDMIATVSAQLTCNMHNFARLPSALQLQLLGTVFATALEYRPDQMQVFHWRDAPGFTIATSAGRIYFDHNTNQLTANCDTDAGSKRYLALATLALTQLANLATQLLLAQIVQHNFKTIAQTTTPAGAIAMTIEV